MVSCRSFGIGLINDTKYNKILYIFIYNIILKRFNIYLDMLRHVGITYVKCLKYNEIGKQYNQIGKNTLLNITK